MTKASRVVGILYHLRDSFDKQLKEKIKKEDIPIKWNHVGLFMILSSLGEELEYREVANVWNKSKSTLSDIVNRYENLGFIEKNYYDENKKLLYIKLTKEGKMYGDYFEKLSVEFLDEGYKGLTEEEIDVFIKVLLNIRKKVD